MPEIGVDVNNLDPTAETGIDTDGLDPVIGVEIDGVRGPRGFTGPEGPIGHTGEPGHTPVITAEKSGGVTTIYVDGTQIAEIADGVDGTDGKDGADGRDGIDAPSRSMTQAQIDAIFEG